MDGLNDIRAGDAEQVVVALEVAFDVVERRVTEVLLFQLILLNHSAHRAVKKDDALSKKVCEKLAFSGQRLIWKYTTH